MLVRGVKKTLKLKLRKTIGVRTNVLAPLKEIMVEFFSTVESLAEANAAFPAKQQLGQLGLIKKGSGYDFCCLLLAVQSDHLTVRRKKRSPKKVQKAHGGESKKVHHAVGSKAAKGRKGPSAKEVTTDCGEKLEHSDS